jgi:hypothetical protein
MRKEYKLIPYILVFSGALGLLFLGSNTIQTVSQKKGLGRAARINAV